MYDGAKKQLEKGEYLLKDILKPLASLSDSWRHFGFKCFPEVKNRAEFLKVGVPEYELQVSLNPILTDIGRW